MCLEDVWEHWPPTTWRRLTNLEPHEMLRFPYAVFEMKVASSSGYADLPMWVESMKQDGLLLEMHKFSKYLTGCATLMAWRVHSVPGWLDFVGSPGDDPKVRIGCMLCLLLLV